MRIIAMLLAALAPALASAQDIPGRVGRIAHIEGSAAVYRDPDIGWDKAWVNSPVTSENSIWTEPDSRAELRVGGTAIRINEATQLDMARLDDNELEAFVPRGTVSVRARHFDPRQERMTFNTPYAQFRIVANGRYRIDVDPDREEARITVFQGDARVGSDSGYVRAAAGETVRIFGGPNPEYVSEAAYRDPFDQWAEARDKYWVESRSVQYVSPNMTGYEDLDSYGQWGSEAELGAVWYPSRVEADWAPYRYGHWGYVQPWGWTWVDDAPWGYAPFHYGRWVYVGNRWGWCPGQRVARPVWAPALVAFIGNASLSVGVSGGSPVGWYPLSPWDRYQPWYRASNTYVQNVNIVVNNYVSRPAPAQYRMQLRERGATVVNREAFLDRRPVHQAMVRVNPDALRTAQAVSAQQVSSVLPTRTEVVQRRESTRTESAAAVRANAASATAQNQGAARSQAQGNNRAAIAAGAAAAVAGGAALVSRPDFRKERTQAAATAPAPQQAASAPPPKPVTPPNAAAQQQARQEAEQRRAQSPARQIGEANRQRAQQQQSQPGQQPQPGQPQQQAQQPPRPQDAAQQQRQQAEQQRQQAAQERQQPQQQQQQQQQQRQQAEQQRQQAAQERAAQERAAQQQQQQQRQQAEQQRQQTAQERQQQQQQQQQQQRQQAEQQRQQAEQQRQQAAQEREQRAREAQQQQRQQAEQQRQQQAQERAAQQQQRQQAEQQRQQQAQERAAQQQQQRQQAEQQRQQQAQQRAQQAEQQRQQQAQQQQQRQEKAKSEKEKEKEKEDEKKNR